VSNEKTLVKRPSKSIRALVTYTQKKAVTKVSSLICRKEKKEYTFAMWRVRSEISACEISHCSHPSYPTNASQSLYHNIACSKVNAAISILNIARGAGETGSLKKEYALLYIELLRIKYQFNGLVAL
jgi:hypothetical protein